MPNKQISPEISSLFSLVKKPKFLSAVSDQILYTDDIFSGPTPLVCPKTVFKHMEMVSIGESSVERYTQRPTGEIETNKSTVVVLAKYLTL